MHSMSSATPWQIQTERSQQTSGNCSARLDKPAVRILHGKSRTKNIQIRWHSWQVLRVSARWLRMHGIKFEDLAPNTSLHPVSHATQTAAQSYLCMPRSAPLTAEIEPLWAPVSLEAFDSRCPKIIMLGRASRFSINLLAKDLHFTKKSKAKPWNTGMQLGPRFLANDIRLSFSANWKSNSSTSSSYKRARVQSEAARSATFATVPKLLIQCRDQSLRTHTLLDSHMRFKPITPYPILVIRKILQRPLELVQEKIKLLQAISNKILQRFMRLFPNTASKLLWSCWWIHQQTPKPDPIASSLTHLVVNQTSYIRWKWWKRLPSL